MKNRIIPFGYQMKNGNMELNPHERVAIEMVYRLRIAGKTYADIARMLAASGIKYNGDAGWDKHKVKRILENRRYMGAGRYPAIVSRETFEEAGKVLEKVRQRIFNPCPAEIQKLKPYMLCGECGNNLLRSSIKQAALNPYRWKCDGCGSTIVIQDDELLKAIQGLIKKESNILRESLQDECGGSFDLLNDPKITLLENEIDRKNQQPDTPESEMLILFQKWMDEIYEAAKDEHLDHTDRMRELMYKYDLEKYQMELVETVVKSVTLSIPCSVSLTFINGDAVSEDDNGRKGESLDITG